MAYDFATQLAKGKEVERKLDLFFADQFDRIEEVTMLYERKGIDRVYWKDGRSWDVEYKADFKAHATGNFFAETVAYGTYEDGQFKTGKPGWVFTSQADILIYVVMSPKEEEGLGTAYLARPRDLRAWMDAWAERYRSVQVRNNGFQGRGLLVPLRELEKVSVIKIAIQ